METKIEIVAIKILDRIKEAKRLQKTLSKYSDIIKTRFGYHDLNDYRCSRNALVILELEGSNTRSHELFEELSEIGGIVTKVMSFNN
jgi:hypothetical protein